MRSSFLALTLLASTTFADERHVQTLLVPEKFQEVVVSNDAARTSDQAAIKLGHYGHPPDECEEDEIPVQISGIPGAICTAKCSTTTPCPTDLPDEVTAKPTCALKDQNGNEYCVLLCRPGLEGGLRSGVGQCGEATCQPVQGLGICTYDA